MNTFEQMTERGHEFVAFHQEPQSGLRTIVAVHSTALGPGFGGARRWHYATEADALYDVLRLSEGMTYKSAVANIPMGGGKAVILLPKPIHKAAEAEARAMGRFVNSLGGQYISAEDVGLTPQYVDWMAQETKFVSGGEVACPGGDPSPFTAQGVVNAMKAALAYTGKPVDFGGLTVAIQGAGNVGSTIARILAAAGATVYITDIDRERVERAVDAYGVTATTPEEILTMQCDILSPCALGGVITAGIIRKLRCPIICGGANNILGDYDEDGVAVQGAGIIYVPDFVANAGGLIELAGVYLGLSESDRRSRIGDIEANAMQVLREAESMPSTYAAAVELAKRKIRRATSTNDAGAHAESAQA